MTVVNGDWCGCAVWVDLNNDNDFDDAGENLYTIYTANALNTYSFNITVPSGTSNGLHQMRVIACWGSDGVTVSPNGYGPCGTYQYGNYDDFTLNVGGAPVCLPPTGLNATALTSLSATANWTAVGGAAGYEYVLDNTSSNPSGSGTATTNTSVNLTGLNPATVYYFHIRTNCGASFSNWTSFSFTTLSGCTIPTGLMTTSITASSATLSWTMVTGAANYEYVIDNIATNPTGVGTQTPNAFYNAGGLSPATLYYFHLRSDCGIGNYSQWTSTSFTTASLCNTPTGLTAANVGATSADLSWTAVSGAIGYQYVVDMSSMNPSGPGTGTTATTYSASGLNPSSTYYLHVRTQCSTTDFSAWSTIPFTTKTPNGLTDVNKDAFEWSLSPVPVQHILTLEIAGVNRRGSIQVCDVSGRKLKEVTYMGGILSMDLHDLESGYYWLRYANGSQMSTRAFLKQ